MPEIAGEIVGAILIVLGLSLLFRMGILKMKRFKRRSATTVACILASLLCTLGASGPMGPTALFIYPLAGVVVWVWLYFDLPIYKKEKFARRPSTT